ncbi:MAG: PilN domain-containing protein [Phycisphaerae bacterium]
MRKSRVKIDRRNNRRGTDFPVRVNLLSEDVQLRTNIRRKLQFWGLLLAGSLTFVGIGSVAVRSTLYDDKELRALIDREYQRIRESQRVAAKLAARADVFVKQSESLSAARAPVTWARFIRETAAMLPAQAYLERLEIVPIRAATETLKPGEVVKEEYEVRLKGYALQYASVLQAYDKIRDSGEFKSVSLDRSGAAQLGESSAIEFTISCRR